MLIDELVAMLDLRAKANGQAGERAARHVIGFQQPYAARIIKNMLKIVEKLY